MMARTISPAPIRAQILARSDHRGGARVVKQAEAIDIALAATATAQRANGAQLHHLTLAIELAGRDQRDAAVALELGERVGAFGTKLAVGEPAQPERTVEVAALPFEAVAACGEPAQREGAEVDHIAFGGLPGERRSGEKGGGHGSSLLRRRAAFSQHASLRVAPDHLPFLRVERHEVAEFRWYIGIEQIHEAAGINKQAKAAPENFGVGAAVNYDVHCKGPFLTSHADDSSGLDGVNKLTPLHLSRGLLINVATPHKTYVSSPKMRARSDRKAGAVRGRSLSPRPAAKRSVGLLCFSCLLTPARLDAISWRGQSWRSDGFGWRFQAGTAWNLERNLQTSDIQAFSARFQRFHVSASHDVRVYVRACVCVHARTSREERTGEPWNQYLFLLIIIEIEVPRVVPSGSSLEPAYSTAGQAAEFPGFVYILVGGNGPDRACLCGAAARRGLLLGRAGISFGDFAWARRADRGVEGGVDRAAAVPGRSIELVEAAADRPGARDPRNGGIPPFSQADLGHVGRVMLEGGAQDAGFACELRHRRKPVRLGRDCRSMTALSDQVKAAQHRRRPPPCPHFARARSLSPWRTSVAGFGSACRIQAWARHWPDRAKPASGVTGRGESPPRRQRKAGMAGRAARVVPEEITLRRIGEPNGGFAHVN